MVNPNHKKYWTQRNDDINRWLDVQDTDQFKRLSDAYSEALRTTQKDLYSFFGKYAEDNQLTMQQVKQRLRGTDLSDYRENARRYFEEADSMPEKQRQELLARLNEQYKASQVTRLDSLQMDLAYELGQLNTNLQPMFQEYLQMVAQYVYQNAMGTEFYTTTLNRPALQELVNRPIDGYNYSEDLWGNTDNLAKRIRETFNKGFVNGSSVQEMARDLKRDFNVKQSDAETLVRTDGSHIVNNSILKRYEHAGLIYVRIHVHLDERTTDTCRKLYEDDERYLLKDMERNSILPAHYNCRSTYMPDMDELMSEDY